MLSGLVSQETLAGGVREIAGMPGNAPHGIKVPADHWRILGAPVRRLDQKLPVPRLEIWRIT